MERPSHIDIKSSQSVSRRLTAFGMAAAFPIVVLWGLTQGLGSSVVEILRGPLQVQLDPQVTPRTPPPDPHLQDVETIKPVAPDFKSLPDPKADDTVTVSQQPPRQAQTQTVDIQPAGPDRAPSGIVSTHTLPPYPMLAQRIGAEGKVTLRVTVLADGRVSEADIVTSSGRQDLDDAARQWIVGHWRYQPALDHGQPVAGQTLATVLFRLENGR